MRISTSMRWLVVAVSAAMLLAVAAACSSETIEVPGETVVVKEEVIKTVEVPGETVVKEVVKEVMVPGETVVVEKVVTETVEVPGETVVVEKEVVKTVEVPGETVTVEVVKEVMVPGQTVVVEKEVVKTVEVPGETVVVEKEVVKTVEVPGETVVVEKEVVKTVEVAGPERVMVKEVRQGYVFDPATGMTWTAPQYGGTLTWGHKQFPKSTDPYSAGGWPPHFISGVNEKLTIADWAISREKTFDLNWYYTGPEMYRGNLAESWSMPDDTTFIWNIRQGVYWEDKAPVNGREFDAYDVEWNFHRYLGLGDFTEDGPGGYVGGLEFESVTATDKWTVEIKLAKPQLNAQRGMLHNSAYILPPEVIEKYGDYVDWRNVVGTGPYRLTDHVEDTSATWEKNPDYWGVDEKFGNRIPYIDELKSLLIADISARLAAMRTGKIDMLSNTGDAHLANIDHVESLQKTNPEIDVWPADAWPAGVFMFNHSLPLTQDVNVRKALQMSIDRETISATFYKGWADPAPYGFIKEAAKGYAWPYDEWPEEVKAGYMYDPEGAEALLDAAGYKRGADGYRLTLKIGHHARNEPTYTEIIMGYFDAIGVKSEMVVITDPELPTFGKADTHELHLQGWVVYGTKRPFQYMYCLTECRGWKWSKTKDQRMLDLIAAMKLVPTMEEWQSYSRQVDEITVREHWGLVKSHAPLFSVSQPWVEGYAGEFGLGFTERNTHFARLWIDSELKEAMGR